MKTAVMRMRGFMLVEIAVALAVLGLLLLGAVTYWQQQQRQRVAEVQMQSQTQAQQALIGFAQARYRLPCPAIDTQGLENCASGQVGFLPWQTLQLPKPEAGRLRYGVSRQAATEPELDQDLAVARDRMNPLRVPTSVPRAQNNTAPNGQLPRLPAATEGLIGASQSGQHDEPLNAACETGDTPPCSATPASHAVNLIDLCLALNRASDSAAAPDGVLGVNVQGSRMAVAFVLAAPGLLNASGSGNAFDGANASASSTSPTFESPSAAISSSYDDQVVAVSHAQLFAHLQCAPALAAISHTHFNAATAAVAMERGLYDFRDQLYVSWKLADSAEAAAGAGIASAASALLDGAKEIVSATADTTMSAGARSFQIGLSIAATAAAGVAAVQAAVAMAMAVEDKQGAWEDWEDYADNTTAATALAESISRNALRADAMGF